MKSEFLYSATHELRNPIAIIFGFSELLLNTEFNRDASIDILQTIHEQAKELNHLTNELLDIARIESRKGKDFSLSEEAIENILQTVRKEWCGRVGENRIRLIMPKNVPSVHIDRDKIKQAITNIMSNACKYSPEDSVVSIEVILDKVTSDSMVGIAIRDKGFGMSKEDLTHSFERFWRSDRFRNIPGTGLGMSIVKEIIDYHQGLIEIDSALNQGTTVTIWLPIYIDLAML
ncbi:HAMP domain-containing sensor histidine kinase [Methylotenera sp.]|uniref:sensor histidine kinase n=1 Tax=Methylotenera sp. TaxID=2051956 RepID=UPI0025CBC6C2|nr:HAMP domain-containing sensor histidine kinase [Methylotenera sp.]